MKKINLGEKLSSFSSHWDPKVIAELNGQQVKLVKFKGGFVWHHHDNEDELFLVVHGCFVMQLKEKDIELGEGEMLIIPRGVEHRPFAEEEVHVLVFEPAATLNTGNTTSVLTKHTLEHI